MKKILALIMSVLMITLVFAGCNKTTGDSESTTEDASAASASASDYAYITTKGTLVVGITDYAPMDYKDSDGNWTGFDAEFAKAVADKMGVTVEFVEIDWDNKFFELNSKAIDCIWNGMTITDEVKLNTSVSNAYVQNKQVVVMKADAVSKYADVASMKALSFAVEAGSAGESAAKDNGLTYTAVTAQSDALLEVASGSSDACIIDKTMAQTMTGTGTSYSDLDLGLELTDEEYGIGFRKNSDMTEKVNAYMAELISDGTLKTLADKYKLTLAG